MADLGADAHLVADLLAGEPTAPVRGALPLAASPMPEANGGSGDDPKPKAKAKAKAKAKPKAPSMQSRGMAHVWLCRHAPNQYPICRILCMRSLHCPSGCCSCVTHVCVDTCHITGIYCMCPFKPHADQCRAHVLKHLTRRRAPSLSARS